jgi:hypothetical protein
MLSSIASHSWNRCSNLIILMTLNFFKRTLQSTGWLQPLTTHNTPILQDLVFFSSISQ